MKILMNVERCSGGNPKDGIDFKALISSTENFEVIFTATAQMSANKRHYDIYNQFSDYDQVSKALDGDTDTGIRLYNAFIFAVRDMMKGIVDETIKDNQYTVVTLTEHSLTLETKERTNDF